MSWMHNLFDLCSAAFFWNQNLLWPPPVRLHLVKKICKFCTANICTQTSPLMQSLITIKYILQLHQSKFKFIALLSSTMDLSSSIATEFDAGQLKFPYWSACIPVTICKMHLFKLTNVFVQNVKCICANFKVYLYKFWNVFVWQKFTYWPSCIPATFCQNWLTHMSKLHLAQSLSENWIITLALISHNKLVQLWMFRLDWWYQWQVVSEGQSKIKLGYKTSLAAFFALRR